MILVTGGTGFIGSHLVERLAKTDQKILVIDDFNDFYNPTFKQANSEIITAYPNVVLAEGSITDRDFINELFRTHPIETVVHLAARAGVQPSLAQPLLYQDVNIGGTLNILEAMRQTGCQRFYFASSSSVYGNQTKTPFSEQDRVDTPISPYAASKKSCELIAYTYHHLYGIQSVGWRFFTVYGERGRPDMAPYIFTEKILNNEPIKRYGNGTTKRDYTYVGDIVEGIIQSLNRTFDYEIFNLGHNQPVALNDFIATIEKVSGKTATIIDEPERPGDVAITYADISKAKHLLEWEPKISLETGLDRFVRWFETQRR